MISPFEDFGSDEHRALEGIAALLYLNPRDPKEDDESLSWRMADWALLQGPAVRWDAMLHAVRAMVKAQQERNGLGFTQLSQAGVTALGEYNRLYGGG